MVHHFWNLFVILLLILNVKNTQAIQSSTKSSALPRTWHTNNQNILRDDSPQCQEYHKQNDALELDVLTKKYKLWPMIGRHTHHRHQRSTPTTSQFTPNNSVIYGLEYTLDAIWKNQHPPNCSEANFLILSPHEGGFGSVLHVYGAVLGVAMNLNRVLLENPYEAKPQDWQFNTQHCKKENASIDDEGYRNYECYYEPWSSCTIYDALGPNARYILTNQAKTLQWFQIPGRIVGYLEDDAFINKLRNDTDRFKVMLAVRNDHYKHSAVPNSLRPMLACSTISPRFYYYWWRAVSTTYLLRLNDKTTHWLMKHRFTSLQGNNNNGLETTALPNNDDILDESKDIFTAMYIRRGDKSIEMQLVPTNDYINATEFIWHQYVLPDERLNIKQHKHPNHHSMIHKRKIFLASEDINVMNEVIEWSRNSYYNFTLRGLRKKIEGSEGEKGTILSHDHHATTGMVLGSHNNSLALDYYYDVHYTNLFNRSGLWAEKDLEYKRIHKEEVHPEEEYLSMILNIHYLIHADGWVCTLASNFCRLIDELRATVGGRADLAFVDLSKETCPSQFCCFEGFVSFDWR